MAKLERLFDQGQTDLAKLIQARQRLIQLKTAEIDATWAATQAQADLLLALGAPGLIQGMLNQAEARCDQSGSGQLCCSCCQFSPHFTSGAFHNFSLRVHIRTQLTTLRHT